MNNREYAIECARIEARRHHADHSYLPQSDNDAISWAPHEWVISAILRRGQDSIFEAYATWPDDVKKKLSAHDLRRMGGFRGPDPLSLPGWIFVTVDDLAQPWLTWCNTGRDIRTAVEYSVFGGECVDDEQRNECSAIADELVARGRFDFEGDKPIRLYQVCLLKSCADANEARRDEHESLP